MLGEGLFKPNRLCERAVGRDVPDFETDPAAIPKFGLERERLAAVGCGVSKVDALAIDLLAVAGNNFGEGKRKGPLDVGAELGRSSLAYASGLRFSLACASG